MHIQNCMTIDTMKGENYSRYSILVWSQEAQLIFVFYLGIKDWTKWVKYFFISISLKKCNTLFSEEHFGQNATFCKNVIQTGIPGPSIFITHDVLFHCFHYGIRMCTVDVVTVKLKLTSHGLQTLPNSLQNCFITSYQVFARINRYEWIFAGSDDYIYSWFGQINLLIYSMVNFHRYIWNHH